MASPFVVVATAAAAAAADQSTQPSKDFVVQLADWLKQAVTGGPWLALMGLVVLAVVLGGVRLVTWAQTNRALLMGMLGRVIGDANMARQAAPAAADGSPAAGSAAAGATPGSTVATATQQPGANVPAVQLPRMDAIDREFLPAALELLETPPSPIRIAGLWVICIGVTTALAWSYFGKLDIHAVAQGRIQPSGRSKVVQPLEPGRVLAVAVDNGSSVNEGDILLVLDPTEAGADQEAQQRDLEAARAEAARRKVAVEVARTEELELVPVPFLPGIEADVKRREESVLAADIAQLAATRANLKAQIAEKEATRKRLQMTIEARDRVIKLTRERADMRETLNDKGSLSRALVIDSLQQYEAQIAQLAMDKGQLIETEAGIGTLEAKLNETRSQFIADQSQKMAESARKADHIEQDLIKARSKHERTTLRAPISGTVQQLAVTTVGQVVTTGQSLMTIVPSRGKIEIEALIQNQDIGFVEAGQDAVVKIESFPFTRYGTLNGRIVKVSRDAVDEREAMGLADPSGAARAQTSTTASTPAKSQNLVFPATVSIQQTAMNIDGKQVPLSPGMAVTVEVRTGDRRVIDYLLSPVKEAAGGFGHER